MRTDYARMPVVFMVASMAALIVAAPAGADPLPMKPGKYQVISAIGSKTGKSGEPKKTTRCLRAAEMENPDYVFNARVIDAYKPDATCKAGDVEIKDGKIAYTSECKFEKVRVEGVASSTAYAVMRTATSKASGGVTLTSTLEAKRIGECQN